MGFKIQNFENKKYILEIPSVQSTILHKINKNWLVYPLYTGTENNGENHGLNSTWFQEEKEKKIQKVKPTQAPYTLQCNNDDYKNWNLKKI